jgi:hypothetical protein
MSLRFWRKRPRRPESSIYETSFEIFGIAIQIDELATKAGWSVGRICSDARAAFLGIKVAVRAQNELPDVERAALSLVAALNENGVDAERLAWDEVVPVGTTVQGNLVKAPMIMVVGSKP